MIPRTIPTWQRKNWQEELSDLITEPEELFSILKLDPKLLEPARKACKLFLLRATRSYVSRIALACPDDPLLRQILPLNEELSSSEAYSHDPLLENEHTPVAGVIHKYHGRILLISATQCAINCRYCFRRHFDYQDHKLSRQQWQNSLRYVAENREIEEVILSGGDPLAVADNQIQWLVEQISAIEHVQRLRIHTRLPIVAPSRLNDALLDILESTRLQCVLVIHCNHAQELSDEVVEYLEPLKKRDIHLLNQSVLLKGVNDDAQILIELSKKLFSHGALPYYLHLLDKVKGASHFEVNLSQALSINKSLLANLPGYLVPKLMKEVPNASSKVPVI